jgi:O-antigen/teichoic acid export membrane protein
VLSLFDLGLGTTLNREFARLSVQSDSRVQMRDTLRTLELIYWSVGIALGAVVAVAGAAAAPHWIKVETLSTDTASRALVLMGIALACQWPLALYSAGLMGLQRQVASNVIASAAVTVRTMGALLVLWLMSATVEAFLAWQIVASLAETLVTACVAWRSLPASAPARFRKDLALGIWRFAAGVGAVAVFSVIVSQLDKVMLSGLLPLAAFGYYMLATRVSGALSYLAGPIMASFFPRYSQLHESADEGELRRVYHQSCQLLSFLVLPPAVMLILFPHEILALWTQNLQVAQNASVPLALLAAGTALNALATPPHMLQFASGWTRLALAYSAVAAIVLAPLIYFMTIHFGGIGAAAVWLLLNAVNLLVNVVFTHRRLLRDDMWTWIRSDFALPLAAALAVALAWKWLAPTPAEWTLSLLNLMLASAVAFAVVAAVTPEIRRLATRSLMRNYGF